MKSIKMKGPQITVNSQYKTCYCVFFTINKKTLMWQLWW